MRSNNGMMKQHVLAAAILLAVCPALVRAQEKEEEQDKDKEVSNGVRLGYHLSDLNGEGELTVRNGYYAGYYRNLVKVPMVSASIGLEFNTAGASDGDNDLRLNYVAFPVNGRLKLGLVYFDLGADVAAKVSEKWVVKGSTVEIPEGAGAEPMDVLGHVGVGVKILTIGFDLRYRFGLTEVYEGYRNTGLQGGITTFF